MQIQELTPNQLDDLINGKTDYNQNTALVLLTIIAYNQQRNTKNAIQLLKETIQIFEQAQKTKPKVTTTFTKI